MCGSGSGSGTRPSQCKVSNGNEAENVAVAMVSLLHNAMFEVMWQSGNANISEAARQKVCS